MLFSVGLALEKRMNFIPSRNRRILGVNAPEMHIRHELAAKTQRILFLVGLALVLRRNFTHSPNRRIRGVNLCALRTRYEGAANAFFSRIGARIANEFYTFAKQADFRRKCT